MWHMFSLYLLRSFSTNRFILPRASFICSCSTIFSTSTSIDDLEKVERAVFNAFGISQNLFNTDGNLSLEKSILNDESTMRNLLSQMAMFFDRITK